MALSGLRSLVASAVQRGVPRADLHDRDPDYLRDNLAFLWLLASFWHRGEVRGLENIPDEGPVLLVGNHSGGNMIVDTFVFTLAFSTYFGVERPFYQLAHDLVVSWPGIGPLLRKSGTVAASHENAEAALKTGGALLVYPGGDWETHRPSWHGDRIEFAERMGFVDLALNEKVPIVPVVAIGGQETALFLTRGERLARMLRLDRMFRLKVLPVSIAAPWGLNVSDMLLHFPAPAKISIDVLPPIRVREEFGDKPDLDVVYAEVVGRMQDALTAMAGRRRLPFFG